ncbi:hypothetical protein ACET3Z_029306 [Daucus carota]
MKRVPISNLCPTCNVKEETTMHCLISCEFAKACCQVTGDVNVTYNIQNLSDWLATVMDVYGTSKVVEMGMLMWSIWKARNQIVWHNTFTHVDEVVRSAHVTFDQWLDAQSKNFTQSLDVMDPMDGKEHWMKPVRNTIKIIVDAALFNDENKFGFGCIARDHTGRLIGARSVSRVGKLDAGLAEAIAFKEALSWTKSKQWNKVTVETDCLTLVKALRSSISIASTFGLVISDCKRLLQDIADADFCFVKRSANRVAHCLARQSYYFSDCIFIEATAPSAVVSLCMRDLNE